MYITLRAARTNAGMTIEEAAKAAGVSPSSLRNWEKGRSEPRVGDFVNLCHLYKAPMDSVFLPSMSRKLDVPLQ